MSGCPWEEGNSGHLTSWLVEDSPGNIRCVNSRSEVSAASVPVLMGWMEGLQPTFWTETDPERSPNVLTKKRVRT